MILKFLKEEKKIRGFLFVDFLLYLSTFLLTPIISIYMRDILAFNSSEIGLIIGFPSIIACFFGGISYLTYKLFGSYRSILISLSLDIYVSIVLLLKGNFQLVLFTYIFKGLSTCIFMPIFKNLYINSLLYENNKGTLFKVKYILICITAVISPYFSNKFYPISKKIIFIIIIILNFIAIFIISYYKNSINSVEVKKKELKLKEFFTHKKSFLIFILGCILILATFSQFEGTFILTIKENSLDVFSKLLILNSVFGIILQIINIKFFKKITSYYSIIIGCIFFSIAYLSFFLQNNYLYLVLAVFLFTIGETFVLPNIESYVTEISNNENRILLYGILEFKRLGFFLGPFLSGVLLKNFSIAFMFLFFSGISLLSCLIFIYYQKIKERGIL